MGHVCSRRAHGSDVPAEPDPPALAAIASVDPDAAAFAPVGCTDDPEVSPAEFCPVVPGEHPADPLVCTLGLVDPVVVAVGPADQLVPGYVPHLADRCPTDASVAGTPLVDRLVGAAGQVDHDIPSAAIRVGAAVPVLPARVVVAPHVCDHKAELDDVSLRAVWQSDHGVLYASKLDLLRGHHLTYLLVVHHMTGCPRIANSPLGNTAERVVVSPLASSQGSL